jgi:hypothetical protein
VVIPIQRGRSSEEVFSIGVDIGSGLTGNLGFPGTIKDSKAKIARNSIAGEIQIN